MDKERVRVDIDSDTQIHLLSFLAEYHGFLDDDVRHIDMNSVEWDMALYSVYLLGNIEGKLLSNNVDGDDMEMIHIWQENLEIRKAVQGANETGSKKFYPCDGPEGLCPFEASYGSDCYHYCGLGAYDEELDVPEPEELEDPPEVRYLDIRSELMEQIKNMDDSEDYTC